MIESWHVRNGHAKQGEEWRRDKEEGASPSESAAMTIGPGADPRVDPWGDEAGDAADKCHLHEGGSLALHQHVTQGSNRLYEHEAEVVPHQPKEEHDQLAPIVTKRPNRIEFGRLGRNVF